MYLSAFARVWLLSALLLMSVVGCGDTDEMGEKTADHFDARRVGPRGILTGHVRLDGDAPTLEPLVVGVNQDVCGAATRNDRVDVDPNGGLGGVVVYLVTDARRDTVPSEAQVMDQVSCVYSPRVIAALPGSVIRFTNSDPTRHNVRIEDPATGRMLLNVAQERGKVDEWKVPGVGTYTVLCDYHPWMNAYVVGVPSPHYAVTSADGSFTIANIPEGEHRLRAWMNGAGMTPKLDNRGQLIGYRFADAIERDTTVKVAPNATATVELRVRVR